MMINKKGFTLVELLATIVLISLISSIAIVSYNSFINHTRNKVYENYSDTVHDEIIMDYINKRNTIPQNNETIILYLNELNITEINNPDNPSDKCKNTVRSKDSYIEIKRKDSLENISLQYKVCLKCQNYNKCKEYVD